MPLICTTEVLHRESRKCPTSRGLQCDGGAEAAGDRAVRGEALQPRAQGTARHILQHRRGAALNAHARQLPDQADCEFLMLPNQGMSKLGSRIGIA